MFAIAGIMLLSTVSAFAGEGCKKIAFHGTYTSPILNDDVFGDGSVFHSTTYLLELRSDGTAGQTWTGFPDFMITTGTGTPWVGSWTCRNDGKLVVSMMTASYTPIPPDLYPPVVSRDLRLLRHLRYTYLFSIDDENTVTRVQLRIRRYSANEDPSDPAGGLLGSLGTAPVAYKRFVASDADLVAP